MLKFILNEWDEDEKEDYTDLDYAIDNYDFSDEISDWVRENITTQDKKDYVRDNYSKDYLINILSKNYPENVEEFENDSYEELIDTYVTELSWCDDNMLEYFSDEFKHSSEFRDMVSDIISDWN